MDYCNNNKVKNDHVIIKQEKEITTKVIYLGGFPSDVDKQKLRKFIYFTTKRFNIEEMTTHYGKNHLHI